MNRIRRYTALGGIVLMLMGGAYAAGRHHERVYTVYEVRNVPQLVPVCQMMQGKATRAERAKAIQAAQRAIMPPPRKPKRG